MRIVIWLVKNCENTRATLSHKGTVTGFACPKAAMCAATICGEEKGSRMHRVQHTFTMTRSEKASGTTSAQIDRMSLSM